jgi:hypothetical protein
MGDPSSVFITIIPYFLQKCKTISTGSAIVGSEKPEGGEAMKLPASAIRSPEVTKKE